MLLAEDLMLLLLDSRSGKAAASSAHRQLLGGAVMIELAMLGRVERRERQRPLLGRQVVLTAIGSGPLPDPLLEHAWQSVAARPTSVRATLNRLGRGLSRTVTERLVQRGVLTRRTGLRFGLVPTTVYPAVDTTHELAVNAPIRAALTENTVPDPRTASLIGLLSVKNALPRALQDMQPPLAWSAQIQERAARIREGDWGATAVRDAVNAQTAATVSEFTSAAIFAIGS